MPCLLIKMGFIEDFGDNIDFLEEGVENLFDKGEDWFDKTI
jgi:hypothetical protein